MPRLPVFAGSIILVAALGRPVTLAGQTTLYTIRGEVRDTAGQPLDQVQVVALSESRIVRTGPDGRFVLDSITPGELVTLANAP